MRRDGHSGILHPLTFFRTMEDASAVDLDWFWKGWFYTTDFVDVSVENVKWYRMQKDEANLEGRTFRLDNAVDDQSSLIGQGETFVYQGLGGPLGEFRSLIDESGIKQNLGDKNFYEVTFKNKGGLVTPLLIEWSYEDGTKELQKVPAEIWRMNEQQVTKVFIKEKRVTHVVLDPERKTADTFVEDNIFPRQENDSRFERYKTKRRR